jgi:hypothetical protein
METPKELAWFKAKEAQQHQWVLAESFVRFLHEGTRPNKTINVFSSSLL